MRLMMGASGTGNSRVVLKQQDLSHNEISALRYYRSKMGRGAYLDNGQWKSGSGPSNAFLCCMTKHRPSSMEEMIN